MLAVALPQGLHEFRLARGLGVQPLLELVEDEDHFLACGQSLAAPQPGEGFRQGKSSGQGGTQPCQRLERADLGLVRRGLDVGRKHVAGQAQQKPGLHQR